MSNRIRTGRDPYARHSITKKAVRGNCDWCGQSNKHGKVWAYIIEDDQGPRYGGPIQGKFCGIDCLNNYHN